MLYLIDNLGDRLIQISNMGARRKFLSGGSEVHQERACQGVAAWGVPGAEPPDAGEVFKRFGKNK